MFAVYPCPLFSVRFRKPLFGETGHTIMNLLAVSTLPFFCLRYYLIINIFEVDVKGNSVFLNETPVLINYLQGAAR